MNDPIERVGKVRPHRRATASALAGAERDLFNAISLENADDVPTGGSIDRTQTIAVDAGHAATEQRRRRTVLVSALVAVMVMAVGITGYVYQGPSSKVADELAVADTAQSDERQLDDEDTGPDEPGKGLFADADLSGPTFDLEADDMRISVEDGHEYRPNGDVRADGYHVFEDGPEAILNSLGGDELKPQPTGVLGWEWQDREHSDVPVDVSISMDYMFDETSWWISSVTVIIDENPDVYVAEGVWSKTPIGQSFVGDVTIALEPDTSSGGTSSAKLTIKNSNFRVYSEPSMCREPQDSVAINNSEASRITGNVGVDSDGYFASLFVVDTETCQVAEPNVLRGREESRYTISATSADETILKINNGSSDSLVGLDFVYLKVGETEATFTITEKSSGDVVHSVELPVYAERPDEAIIACKAARENGNKYALVKSWTAHSEARLSETSGVAQLWNAETCQPEPVADFDFEATSEDPNIATVEAPTPTDGDGTFDDRPDAIRFEISKKRSGETNSLITVIDPNTGEVVAELVYLIEVKV